jgi:hypothetical protein
MQHTRNILEVARITPSIKVNDITAGRDQSWLNIKIYELFIVIWNMSEKNIIKFATTTEKPID